MTTYPAPADLLMELAGYATSGDPGAWAVGARRLESLDGRSWLQLDEVARSGGRLAARPVSGSGWTDPHLTESSGFVAAITSLHEDGRIRQRATQVLAGRDGVLAVTALAVRSLDHVPQVRDDARAALVRRVEVENASAVLGVLLAGRHRRDGRSALETVREAVLGRSSAQLVVAALLDDRSRDVRRWALTAGVEAGLVPVERLAAVVRSDRDQWCRATAAEALLVTGDPRPGLALLRTSSVEARLAALSRLPDDVLGDAELLPLLLDPASRVREQARWRARRRGVDVARWYRQAVAEHQRQGRSLAAALDGLAEVGAAGDLDLCVRHLGHPSARVRAAAVRGVGAWAAPEDALARLQVRLLDPSARVGAAAVRALGQQRVPAATVEDAWTAPDSATRSRAWRISRRTGTWDRLAADLRAAADPDRALAASGMAGVRNWLTTTAATAWMEPTDDQRDRIRELLAAGHLDDAATCRLAFHVGVLPPATPRPGTRTRRWSLLTRRAGASGQRRPLCAWLPK